MMMDLFDFYSDLRKDGIIFCFSGPTSQGIVEGIGDALLQKMEREEASLATSRKVFSIFVEQMQNVVNHSAEKVPGGNSDDGELRFGIVVLGQEGDKFYVRSGNFIDRSEVEELKEVLEKIQKMDKDELKAFFKEQRRQDRPGNKVGAGLGFIETARKASEPIEFHIANVDEKQAFFSIKARI